MTSVTDQERFDAAVKIITGLPKEGSFQPSNEMKLKFYALFKQATVGPCDTSQPSFWDLVNRAKWSAWKSLGNMPKEIAMRDYVDVLKQVIEMMSLDSNVQDFLEKVGPLYEFVDSARVPAKGNTIRHPGAGSRDGIPNEQIGNGGHSLAREGMNGDFLNGVEPVQDDWSVEQENESTKCPRPSVNNDTISVINKIDLDGTSDEETFDDASDNQAFATNNNAPIQRSSSNSPLSHTSTPPRRDSRPIQSNVEPRVDRSLSPTRRRAATAFGQLLRQLPALGQSQTVVERGTSQDNALGSVQSPMAIDSVVNAWTTLRQIHADQVRRLEDDEDWFMRQFKRSKRAKSGRQKHRGGDHNERSGTAEGADVGSGNGTRPSQEGASHNPVVSSSESANPGRSLRHSSGESSSSNSSGTDFTTLSMDPNVGAILLRMHRELQHINRQLQFVEGVLITQQEMIRGLFANYQSNAAMVHRRRMCFFFDLPWRTIGFIVAWPVLVHILVRLFASKWRRRR